MLRVVHVFDVKPGVQETSFVEWLDARLDEITKRYGCLERKTWVFIDGIQGNYVQGRPERRPKYLNEAFWPSQQHADNFRKWLMSDEGKEFRQRWFDSVQNHTVLRYVNGDVPRPVTDD
ncbi:MAG TPA: hypothetical protein VNM47_03465 [Terriglobia bacterium]|nr:hypothetical protein [Terriglobia bacterium]